MEAAAQRNQPLRWATIPLIIERVTAGQSVKYSADGRASGGLIAGAAMRVCE